MSGIHQNESLVAAIEGNLEGMSHKDLVLTCKMLERGRAIWKKEAEDLKTAALPTIFRLAAVEVDKLAAHFVGNVKIDGTRDSVIYEQGIGCERAAQMLRQEAAVIESKS